MSQFNDELAGQWRGILIGIGIDAKYLTGKNVPCPFCGGKDRFRFINTEGRGTWICNQCGSGNGYELVKLWNKCDFPEAAKVAKKLAGRREPTPKKDDESKQVAYRKKLWHSADRILTRTPVGQWLDHRCGLTEDDYPQDLRAYRHDGGSWSMLAKICDVNGRGHQIHMTNFDSTGRFVDRKFMKGSLPKGGAVRLYPVRPYFGVLGIAEGIETAISAHELFGVPVWAALNAPLLKNWVPPTGLRTVMIFADNDENRVGGVAAYELAARLYKQKVDVEVYLPKTTGDDWNDVWKRRIKDDGVQGKPTGGAPAQA